MKMDRGNYRGCELSEVPTEYLEWAVTHLRLDGPLLDGVMAEQSRRANAARVAAETPMQRALEKPAHIFNKLVARARLAVKGD